MADVKDVFKECGCKLIETRCSQVYRHEVNIAEKLHMVFGFIETFSTDSLPHLKTYNFEEIMTAMSFSIDSGR